jgi:hypothetical protein
MHLRSARCGVLGLCDRGVRFGEPALTRCACMQTSAHHRWVFRCIAFSPEQKSALARIWYLHQKRRRSHDPAFQAPLNTLAALPSQHSLAPVLRLMHAYAAAGGGAHASGAAPDAAAAIGRKRMAAAMAGACDTVTLQAHSERLREAQEPCAEQAARAEAKRWQPASLVPHWPQGSAQVQGVQCDGVAVAGNMVCDLAPAARGCMCCVYGGACAACMAGAPRGASVAARKRTSASESAVLAGGAAGHERAPVGACRAGARGAAGSACSRHAHSQ